MGVMLLVVMNNVGDDAKLMDERADFDGLI